MGPPIPDVLEALKDSHPKLKVITEPVYARLSKKPLQPK